MEGGGKQSRVHKRKGAIPAETGRPETSKEFSARMSKYFVLKGPQQQKEDKDSRNKKPTIQILACKQNDNTVQANSTAETIDKVKEMNLEQAQDKVISEQSQMLQNLTKPLNPISLPELMAGGQEPIDLLE
ncbi:hypothetical protein C0995_008717, partial [Termitomyces sp. Mi166